MRASRIWTIARDDTRLTLRDGSAIFWIFIAPFLWVFFFGMVNRGASPGQVKVGLTVLQQDTSAEAEQFLSLLQGQNFTLTIVKPGETAPSGDDAPSRTLTIPAGFGEAIRARRKITLDLSEREGANPDGTFAAQVALHKAIVRYLAGEALGELPPGEDAVRVKASWASTAAPPTGYYQTIPGNLVMFILIAAMTYGAAHLASEKTNGMLRRLEASPLTRAEILAGKLVGRALVAMVQVGVFVLMAALIFRISWGGSLIGLVLMLLALILCAASLGLLGGAVFRTPQAASGFGIVLVLAMSALGGCWWPAEVMPRWMQRAGHVFPTAWAMDGLHELLSWGGGLADVLLPAGVLLLYGLAAAMVGVRRLKAIA